VVAAVISSTRLVVGSVLGSKFQYLFVWLDSKIRLFALLVGCFKF